MKMFKRAALAVAALCLTVGVAQAGKYEDTLAVFREAPESGSFFKHSYAYAVFPTVGEGGFIVGAAIGKGRVYVHKRRRDHGGRFGECRHQRRILQRQPHRS